MSISEGIDILRQSTWDTDFDHEPWDSNTERGSNKDYSRVSQDLPISPSEDVKSCADLIRKIASKLGLQYPESHTQIADVFFDVVQRDVSAPVSLPLSSAFCLYPPAERPVGPSDLPMVLRCLTQMPFDPAASCNLCLLTLKTVFLVAITLARRASELSALDIRAPFLTFLPNAVELQINVRFLPKVVSEFHLHSAIILPDFYPTPTSDAERLLHTLDVTRALEFYLHRTYFPE